MKYILNGKHWLVNRTFLTVMMIAFSAVSFADTPVECPHLRSPKEAADMYMKAEIRGVRLSSVTMERMDKCFSTDNEIGWDENMIVDGYTLTSCESGKENCVLVKYRPLARLSADLTVKMLNTPIDQFKSFELIVKKRGEKWIIKGLLSQMPLVSAAGMIEFIQTNLQNGPDTSTTDKVIEELKKL